MNAVLLTLPQAERRLRVSRSTIYRLAKRKHLELVKFDRATRVTERSLNRLLAELKGLIPLDVTMRRLGCSRGKIDSLARQGRLERIKKFGSTYVTERSLQELLDAIETKPFQANAEAS